MTLLVPLGLLGLLGVVALIIIYIIRPNYQQKFISSTYIWKLSLKYRKKRIPTSKLRNILLILCQVCILLACTAILTKPVRVLKTVVDETEIIAIIDSSASMRSKMGETSRFDRALAIAQEDVEDILNNGGIASVILAENHASFVLERITAAEKTKVEDAFAPLLEDGCAYGSSDVKGAIALCEDVLLQNPSAKICLYTDTEYAYVPEGITVENVAEEDEWNAAILDARTELNSNYHTFIVDVAYYGNQTKGVELTLDIINANPEDENGGGIITLKHNIVFNATSQKQIIFIADTAYSEMFEGIVMEEDDSVEYVILYETDKVYSYKTVYFSIDTGADAISIDNTFNLYNGQKEIVKVQYSSAGANPFFRGVLLTMQAAYAKKWDIRITEVKTGEEPAIEGFDLYVYEHEMPEDTPNDGLVFFVNPDSVPKGADFRIDDLRRTLNNSVDLTEEIEHPILRHVTASNITVSQYSAISASDSYETLVTCDGNPVLLTRNDADCKVVLMPFSLHYSNLPVLKDFPLLMCKIFEYYFPSTFEKSSFEVYETVELKARGEELTVKLGDQLVCDPFTQFPATLKFDLPGNYILEQTTFTGKAVKEYLYVKLPAAESDIWQKDGVLENPYKVEEESDYFEDLLFYIAMALVTLLFIEWWLQSRETM